MARGNLVSVIQVMNNTEGQKCLAELKKAIRWKYCIHTRCRAKDRRKLFELHGLRYCKGTQNDIPVKFAERHYVYVYERVRKGL